VCPLRTTDVGAWHRRPRLFENRTVCQTFTTTASPGAQSGTTSEAEDSSRLVVPKLYYEYANERTRTIGSRIVVVFARLPPPMVTFPNVPSVVSVRLRSIYVWNRLRFYGVFKWKMVIGSPPQISRKINSPIRRNVRRPTGECDLIENMYAPQDGYFNGRSTLSNYVGYESRRETFRKY